MSVGAPGKIPVTVNSAQFDDGYSQVSEMGLNDAMESWDLTCKGRPAEMIGVRNFLTSNCTTSFLWKNPWGEQKLYRVKADSITPSFTNGNFV